MRISTNLGHFLCNGFNVLCCRHQDMSRGNLFLYVRSLAMNVTKVQRTSFVGCIKIRSEQNPFAYAHRLFYENSIIIKLCMRQKKLSETENWILSSRWYFRFPQEDGLNFIILLVADNSLFQYLHHNHILESWRSVETSFIGLIFQILGSKDTLEILNWKCSRTLRQRPGGLLPQSVGSTISL